MEQTLQGKVIKGLGYGCTLGFPTANLEYDRVIDMPVGIYAGFASREKTDTVHQAAIVIGPKNDREISKIEAHFIDFSENLYGETITLHLKKFIRPYAKFSGEEELKKQITKDVNAIITYLHSCSPESFEPQEK